jgi:iron complex outermembrane receptor protein
MTFRSFAFLEDSLRPDAGQPAYQKFDLRAGVRSAEDRWELAVVGKNPTNKLTSPNTFGTPGAPITSPGGLVKYIHPPRTIALQARLNF